MILDCRVSKKRNRSVGYCETFNGLWFPCANSFFPVAGTLMIEPTESEDVAELDRFVMR
jgi:glycine cleavage system protein P-like pyridoxal-binding family